MKRIGFILLLFTSSVGFAQKYAVKTNLAYWATTTLNIGGEIALAPRMTLDMTANYNPFHFRGNKKIMHWAVQPEWRYWTCRRFMGHFIGVHAHGGKYNGGLKKYRYDDGVSVVVFLMVTNGSSVNTGTWKQNLESGMLT
jgi:hypothetical protein